jgi:predicted MFS family arabinose efflux permease
MILSVVMLFFSGAFDSVSVVIRHTLLQTLTPDDLRGRVMAVNGIFLAASNELGAFESGVAAKLMGTIPSALFGGLMTLGIVTWVYTQSKSLFTIQVSKNGN